MHDGWRRHQETLKHVVDSKSTPVPCCDASAHLTRPAKSHSPYSTALLRSLDSVVEWDLDAQSIWVEAGMTMDQLVRTTLPRGYIPLVVPEFKGITVGGAIAGAALESSSFRYGQFFDCCSEVEVLFENGTVERLSAESHPEIYYALSGSYGAFAAITAARVKLRRCAPTVRVDYQTVDTVAGITPTLKHLCQLDTVEYVDGVIFNDTRTVLMSGRETSGAAPTLHLNRPWSPWFCQHVLQRSCQTDVVPMYDYMFR